MLPPEEGVEVLTRDWVHTIGRLVKKEQVRLRDQGHCAAELSLVASTEILCLSLMKFLEAKAAQDVHDSLIFSFFSPYQTAQKPEVLHHSKILPEDVLLLHYPNTSISKIAGG